MLKRKFICKSMCMFLIGFCMDEELSGNFKGSVDLLFDEGYRVTSS